jgi:hypothetical protein
MEAIMTRVQKALQKEFSPRGITLESVDPGMVAGWIISKSFEGLTGMERTKKIWRLFDKYLDDKDRARIGIMLTLTPLEKKLQLDDDWGDFRMRSKKKPSTRKKAATAGRARNGVRKK